MFKKVGQSEKPMYGPRAILVCGFLPEERDVINSLLKDIKLADVPVIFAIASDSEKRIGDLLVCQNQSAQSAETELSRAIVLSGITENELHLMLSAYRNTGMPSPLWATLTSFSENWTLSALIRELNQERIAMKKSREYSNFK
jgi:hypothetical protein